MVDRAEETVITYRGGVTSQLVLAANSEVDKVELAIQTVETSAVLTMTRGSLAELTVFLSEVAVDLAGAVLLPPVLVDPVGEE